MPPFFSIVIPTRQRHETLPFAIKTVLQQDFLDYEVIISDNCSTRETRDVVLSFNNPKLKYVRSEIPLAMSDNWELAVSQAEGQYIIVFGDDDGLVNGALSYLYKVIQKTNFDLIRWERIYYCWPNVEPKEFANCLTIPLHDNQNVVLKGKDIIKRVINFNVEYTKLPMLYNSAVKKEYLLTLKQQTGRIFKSIVPDVYSGYALAYLAKRYLSLCLPLSINGGAAKSNGSASLSQPDDHPVVNDFRQLNRQSSLSFHPSIPEVRSLTAGILEPFFQLQDSFKINDVQANKRYILKMIMQDVKVFSAEEKQRVIEIFEQYLMKDKEMQSFLRSQQWKEFNPTIIDVNNVKYAGYKKGIQNDVLTLDASSFEILDVLGVSNFVSQFYDFDIDNFDYIGEDVSFSLSRLVKNIKKRIRLSARALVKGF